MRNYFNLYIFFLNSWRINVAVIFWLMTVPGVRRLPTFDLDLAKLNLHFLFSYLFKITIGT